MRRDGIIIYEFSADWKVFDSVGNLVSNKSKAFETELKAEKHILKLKEEVTRDRNIVAVIRKLKGDEIIRRYKKKSGNLNYQRT